MWNSTRIDCRLILPGLRHDGISRLFELGWSIPHVAAVSGRRSWSSLKRYTHIRQRGDKYTGTVVIARTAG